MAADEETFSALRNKDGTEWDGKFTCFGGPEITPPPTMDTDKFPNVVWQRDRKNPRRAHGRLRWWRKVVYGMPYSSLAVRIVLLRTMPRCLHSSPCIRHRMSIAFS